MKYSIHILGGILTRQKPKHLTEEHLRLAPIIRKIVSRWLLTGGGCRLPTTIWRVVLWRFGLSTKPPINLEMKNPLVSCLCVTHQKPLMLRRVIDCFWAQSYKNRLLAVVYERSDEDTSNFLRASVGEDSIKIVEVSDKPVKMPLGRLRNISVREADGDYVCQWDDDWYDPDRIGMQIKQIIGSGLPVSFPVGLFSMR